MQQISWHTKTVPEVLGALGSREHGLTKEEATERFQKYGLNKLPEGKVDGLLLFQLPHQLSWSRRYGNFFTEEIY